MDSDEQYEEEYVEEGDLQAEEPIEYHEAPDHQEFQQRSLAGASRIPQLDMSMTSNGIFNYGGSLLQQMPSAADILLNTANVIVPNQMGGVPLSPSLFLSRQDPMVDISVLPSTSRNTSAMYSGDPAMVTKQEPASSDSQPGTPREVDRRAVPACAICGTDSTGIHFGVDACAACSAFFRRTVVLSKEYACNKGGGCIVLKDGTGGQKCRSCRFAKCLLVGMDRSSVQHRRDAIGKYSIGVKREYSPTDQPSTSNAADKCLSPPSPKASRSRDSPGSSILEELTERHSVLMQKRRIFYANRNCEQLFEQGDMEIVELSNYEECMYQLWRIEPRLAAEYITCNRFLAPLQPSEKVKLFRNFVIQRQAVEEPYITWKCGGLERNWWIMANMTYIDINSADKYWQTGVIKNIKINYNDAKALFESSFKMAMATIGEAMKAIHLTETEMIALCGIALLDPTVATLTRDTKMMVWGLREQLVREMFNFYEGDDSNEEPELRMANLFMILAAVKVHAIKTSENMHLLNTFELIAKDKMFEDICRGNVYDDDATPQVLL